MLSIKVPENNIPEREYIIKTLFTDFLGLKYSIFYSNTVKDYIISFKDSELTIKDGFFANYRGVLSFLNLNSIPLKVPFTVNEFIKGNDIPIIYGNDELIISERKIYCGLDVFASSFFMLTRWEEIVNEIRDSHGRFPGSESTAFKNNFLLRPVVNEYVEMLWEMLKKLGYNGIRKSRKFEVVFTHDIDILIYNRSIKTILGDIFRRKNVHAAFENIKYLFYPNPYNTFDLLMTKSEKLEVKSHFYLMSSSGNSIYDSNSYLNSKLFRHSVDEIKKRGHILGFHPGYDTFDNPCKWRDEKDLLENAIQQKVLEGRQHYLRIDLTKTLSIWEENNMEIDSTLGYADKEGFRCGTGDVFHLFDIKGRRILKLKERPLIVMDGTLRQYQEYPLDKVSDVLNYYISIGKKFGSLITLLFHNSSFYGDWKGYDIVYEKIGIN
ncbi:MAG TPA: polysaccharide deacetylase family protein [Bacteroidales bacterium]|jgi:hypothetical protein|nr:polysaccharide deacetylase family protein [Bacteroidales bacterium]